MISYSQDPDELLVEHEHIHVIGEQYTPFVIPCKPTSPRVKVELIQEGGEVTVISFNDTIGFTLASDTIGHNSVLCKFSLGDLTEEDYHDFNVDKSRSHLAKKKYLSHNRFQLIRVKKLPLPPPPKII